MDSGSDDLEVGQYDGSVTIPCHGEDSLRVEVSEKYIRSGGMMDLAANMRFI